MSTPPTESARNLRRQAEEKLASSGPINAKMLTAVETQRLLHELQVQQIELEMQNEEVHQAITEKDAALEAYRELYEFAPVGYFTLNPGGIIEAVNLTGAALLGVERSILLNNRLDAFIPAETRTVFHVFLEKVFTGEAKETCEVVFTKQDQAPLYVQIEAVVSGTGKNCRAVIIDITGHKQSEKKLAEATRRLEALMAAVPVGISFSDDITCQRITGNPAVLEQFNTSPEENLSASAPDSNAPGRKVKFFLDGREISDTELPLQRAVLENRVIPPMELKVVMPSGKHWFAEASAAPVRDVQGNIIGGIAVTEDITERKQTERMLRVNEERMRSVLKASSIGTFEIDLLTGEAQWNSTLYELLGLQSESMEPGPVTFFRYVHPDDVAMLQSSWEKALLYGKLDAEFRIVRADGEERWLAGKGEFAFEHKVEGDVLNAHRKAQRFLGVNYDITSRKRAEDLLRESEERLRLHLDNSPMAVIEWDKDFIVRRWTGEAERIFGWSADEVVGKPYADLKMIFEDDVPIVEKTIARLTTVESRQVVTTNRNYTKSGEIRYCTWYNSVLTDQEGQIVSVLSNVIDITELKKSQEALSNSEKMYRAIGESIDYGVWLCSPEGRNIYASKSFLDLVGITQEQCSDYGWGDTLHPDDAEQTIAKWKECVRTGELWDIEHRFRGVDGQWHPILARGVPVRDDNGAIIYWVGINLDISRLKQAEEALAKTNDQLELRVAERTQQLEKMHAELVKESQERLQATEALRKNEQMLIQQGRQAAMGEMIGNIAHQWRQPLHIVGMSIQALKQLNDLGELTKEILDERVSVSLQHIQYMSKTINDFGNFFKPDNKKIKFNVSEAVTDALSLVEGSLRNQHIGINVICNDAASVIGYRNQFTQVLLNLLNNARDAFIERAIADPQVTITICSEDGCAVITVADNAGGIPEEIIHKVFDPYFTTKGPQQGTGVGLFMSKTIIEKNMGGRLTAQNRDNGALFRIEVRNGD